MVPSRHIESVGTIPAGDKPPGFAKYCRNFLGMGASGPDNYFDPIRLGWRRRVFSSGIELNSGQGRSEHWYSTVDRSNGIPILIVSGVFVGPGDSIVFYLCLGLHAQPGDREYNSPCCCVLFILVDRALVLHPTWDIHPQAERALLDSFKPADDPLLTANQRHVCVECLHPLARAGYFVERAKQ